MLLPISSPPFFVDKMWWKLFSNRMPTYTTVENWKYFFCVVRKRFRYSPSKATTKQRILIIYRRQRQVDYNTDGKAFDGMGSRKKASFFLSIFWFCLIWYRAEKYLKYWGQYKNICGWGTFAISGVFRTVSPSPASPGTAPSSPSPPPPASRPCRRQSRISPQGQCGPWKKENMRNIIIVDCSRRKYFFSVDTSWALDNPKLIFQPIAFSSQSFQTLRLSRYFFGGEHEYVSHTLTAPCPSSRAPGGRRRRRSSAVQARQRSRRRPCWRQPWRRGTKCI